MSKHPLTPMMVQYLVGLCCLKNDPEAVDVTIGDMVFDPVSETPRDVDVTVTMKGPDDTIYAFKAYEVKREGTPLDVSQVEQLCLKFMDMTSITHPAIVSSSGFTAPARKKAEKHGIKLYEFKPWTRPLEEQFPKLTMRGPANECFLLRTPLLCWPQHQLNIIAEKAPGPFAIQPTDETYNAKGKVHPKFSSFNQYQNDLLMRSTELLLPMVPIASMMEEFQLTESGLEVGPEWPHSHTLEVSNDAVFLKIDSVLCRIDRVTISGCLQWQRSPGQNLFYVIEGVPDGEAFAGAVISNSDSSSEMTALFFSPSTRDIDVRKIQLAKKHRNSIRNLKLELSKRG